MTNQENMVEGAIYRNLDAAFAFINTNRDISVLEVSKILDREWSLG